MVLFFLPVPKDKAYLALLLRFCLFRTLECTITAIIVQNRKLSPRSPVTGFICLRDMATIV